MKTEDIFDIIDQIDDDMIRDAWEFDPSRPVTARPARRMFTWKIALSSAAAACVITAGVIVLPKLMHSATNAPVNSTIGENSSSGAGNSANSENVSLNNGSVVDNISAPPKMTTSAKIYKHKNKVFTEEQLRSLFKETPKKVESDTGDDLTLQSDSEKGHLYGGGMYYYSKQGSFCKSVYQRLTAKASWESLNIEGNLDFATREQAMQALGDYLNSLGIAPGNWEAAEFSAITKATVEDYRKSVYEEATNSDNSDAEKDGSYYNQIKDIPAEDFYCFKIVTKPDGNIPLFSDAVIQVGKTDKNIAGQSIDIVYTQNGFEFVYFSRIVELDNSAAPEEVTLIGEEKAKDAFKESQDVLFDGEIAIKEIDLIYLPIPQNDLNRYAEDFETRPFYVISFDKIEEYEGRTVTTDWKAFIDGVTGEKLTEQQWM